MTPSFDPERSPPLHGGLFRAGEHVAVVRSGGAIAILDLERGTFYAATSDAADAGGCSSKAGRLVSRPPGTRPRLTMWTRWPGSQGIC